MQKSRIRREKSESEILVNGFILARIYHKARPGVVAGRFATAANPAPRPGFIQENQSDSAQKRRLKLAQGAFGYTIHNEGKRGKNPESAVPKSGAPGLTRA
jgi:hypothetical protein